MHISALTHYSYRNFNTRKDISPESANSPMLTRQRPIIAILPPRHTDGTIIGKSGKVTFSFRDIVKRHNLLIQNQVMILLSHDGISFCEGALWAPELMQSRRAGLRDGDECEL
jgi:hypothetical protein